MKRTITVSVIALILLVSFTGCNQNNDGNSGINKVYSLSGENDFIEINNGAIILASGIEKFVGGDLSFKEDELSGVKNYMTEFYFFMDGVKSTINNNIVSIEGSNDGTNISRDLGAVSAETLFSADVWDKITKTGPLYFSLSGAFMNGASFEYNIVVNITDIF